MIGQDGNNVQEASTFLKRAGGAPANVAVAASRLGADVRLTSTVGKDPFGDFLIERIVEEGVKSEIRKVSENTTKAFVSLDKDAEPDFSFHRGADELIDQEIDTSVNVVHIGSLPLTRNDTAENILNVAKVFNGRMSFDPNLREDLVDQGYLETITSVIEETDILFVAKEEIEQLGGREKMTEMVDEIVLTKGGEGAEVISQEKTVEQEPPKVHVKDTTGAGDALAGAYLAFRQQGIEPALEKSVHAAALSTQKKGAMSALPKLKELKNSISE